MKALDLKNFSQKLYNYMYDILALGTDADIVRLVNQPGRFWWLVTNFLSIMAITHLPSSMLSSLIDSSCAHLIILGLRITRVDT